MMDPNNVAPRGGQDTDYVRSLARTVEVARRGSDPTGSDTKVLGVRGARTAARLSRRERLTRGRFDSAREGRHVSGPVPLGYLREKKRARGRQLIITPDPDAAEIIREVFRRYLERRSMKAIVASLRESFPTLRGKALKWSRAKVGWILQNRVYIGRVRFGTVEAKGLHEAIVTRIVWNKVQQLRAWQDKRGRTPCARPAWLK